jgi:hypothetical protein
LASARKALNLVDEHRARVKLIPGIDDHHDLRVPAVADGDGHACLQSPTGMGTSDLERR